MLDPSLRPAAAADRQPYLIDDQGSFTHGALRDAAARLRTLFESRGIGRGDRVVVMTAQPRVCAVAVVGALGANVGLVVADPDGGAAEVAHVLDVSAPAMVIGDRDGRGLAVAMDRGLPVIAVDPPGRTTLAGRLLGRRGRDRPADDFWAVLETVTAAGEPDPSAVDAESEALVLFTSGSSGRPKGVVLSRRALAVHLDQLRVALGLDGAVVHDVLPLHHADGLLFGAVVPYLFGGTWVRPVPFSVGSIPELVDAVHAHRVSHLIAVPTVLALLDRLGSEFLDAFRGEHFEMILSSAAPLGERLWQRVEERFGVVVCNSYGLTETVTSTLLSGPTPDTGRKVGTVGRPLPGITVRLVDEAGDEVPDGVPGEIEIEGDHLFSGYLGDPEGTAEVFDGRRFRTADLAVREADGTYRIVGRSSRMIIAAGHNVAPDEVDDVVGSAPSVIESVTVGVDDEVWGQRVVTAVVADDEFDAAAVLAHCRANLSSIKVPREIIRLDGLPRTPAGKIDARAVATLIGDHRDGPAGTERVEETVLRLAARAFGVDVDQLAPHSDLDSTPGWDSLAHMELVASVEERWSIELTNTEVIGIRTLADVIAAVEVAVAR